MPAADSSVANRITARDAQMLRLIAEHRVLTTQQLTTALFRDAAKTRLRIGVLREAGLIETFQPPGGALRLHCVATAKALKLLGGVQGVAIPPPGRSLAATAAALRPDLAHLRGVNDFFCRLIDHARHHRGAALEVWCSEWSTAALFPGPVRPDGFGRWRDQEAWCEFFLEYDTGTEPLQRLVTKLTGYRDLMHTADTCCPVLFWLRTPGREEYLHQQLGSLADEVPLATAVGDPETADIAGPIWLPAFSQERLALADLGQAACDHMGVPHQPHAL